MYRQNFCSECGTKIIRLHWHTWTSRRFCDSCSRRLRKERLTLPFFAGLIMFSIGLIVGRSARSDPPPLIIQRSANSQLGLQDPETAGGQKHLESNAGAHAASQFEESVYICGARTKKGTPCSRRLHQPVRCWQHKGSPAMLPKEKLVVKE